MDDDHVEEYKGWKIVVTVSPCPSADSAIEHVVPSVVIVRQQIPQRKFSGTPRCSGFSNRRDAIQYGVEAAQAFIDAVDSGERQQQRLLI